MRVCGSLWMAVGFMHVYVPCAGIAFCKHRMPCAGTNLVHLHCLAQALLCRQLAHCLSQALFFPVLETLHVHVQLRCFHVAYTQILTICGLPLRYANAYIRAK